MSLVGRRELSFGVDKGVKVWDACLSHLQQKRDHRPSEVGALRRARDPQIRKFGGEIVAARGNVERLEGDWDPVAVTILRFESKAVLKTWYESPEYAPLKRMRLESNIGDIVVVDGGH